MFCDAMYSEDTKYFFSARLMVSRQVHLLLKQIRFATIYNLAFRSLTYLRFGLASIHTQTLFQSSWMFIM